MMARRIVWECKTPHYDIEVERDGDGFRLRVWRDVQTRPRGNPTVEPLMDFDDAQSLRAFLGFDP